MKLNVAPLLATLLVAIHLPNPGDAARQTLRGLRQRDHIADNAIHVADNVIPEPSDLRAAAGDHSIEVDPRKAMRDELPATAVRAMQYVNDGELVDEEEDVDLLVSNEEEDEETHMLSETMVMSYDEKANAAYVQSVRKSRGLQPLYYSPDLVKEAKRWSKYMSTQGHSSSRPTVDLNVSKPWKRVSEITGRYNSVATTSKGAIASLINDAKSKDKLLDDCYNRIGVGIVEASDGSYYVTILTKAV
jgi:Cysteine-rich secretory protein family